MIEGDPLMAFPARAGMNRRTRAAALELEKAFPVRAGMKDAILVTPGVLLGVPRPRGDEPSGQVSCEALLRRFPPARG